MRLGKGLHWVVMGHKQVSVYPVFPLNNKNSTTNFFSSKSVPKCGVHALVFKVSDLNTFSRGFSTLIGVCTGTPHKVCK